MAAAIQRTNSVESLRSLHAVRSLAPSESELRIEEAPRGTYGFAIGIGLVRPSFRLLRKPNKLAFEVHKLCDGNLMIIGFVGPEAARSMSLDQPNHGLKFVLYNRRWQEAPEAIAIPLDSVKLSDYSRTVEPDEKDMNTVEAMDCEMK